ncbi:GIY-YIG nuclease family protein [Pseudohoeflea suaedae]|uniref:GIY-YIG nuclease family protein n=1 Tax=Pseudohoeflea suaedae TaxID=877384 RepID=A0A4R5PJR7_9HYPH|nr:GIY-YIG nuclease family protein [Pseudohoeflea suaedae]TDH35060.1 GIY-YIG nuclease family protein [Pseudohoeflea suaedae]
MAERSDLDILADLDLEPLEERKSAISSRDARIIAGFEDIQKFVEQHGRPPQHGEGNDIFERIYAVRLDRLRSQPDCVKLLADMDHQGLLSDTAIVENEPAELEDAEILAALGIVSEAETDITTLRYVRSAAEIQAAEEIAERTRCENFEDFEELFKVVKSDLDNGERQTRRFERKSEIEQGRFFILDGVTAYVAEEGEEFTNASGNRDKRLRVIYDNGTESNLLARSLQKALTQDPAGRRITEPDAGPLFNKDGQIDGRETGTIYVLRSLSERPEIAEMHNVLHKIGVTGGDVEKRIVNAAKDPTFLMAPVEIVETFKLYDINRVALENLLHRFLATARLNVKITDRLGLKIQPREWFVVPFDVIVDIVDRIKDGTLHEYVYRPDEARLVRSVQ